MSEGKPWGDQIRMNGDKVWPWNKSKLGCDINWAGELYDPTRAIEVVVEEPDDPLMGMSKKKSKRRLANTDEHSKSVPMLMTLRDEDHHASGEPVSVPKSRHKRNIFKPHLTPIKRFPCHIDLERRIMKAHELSHSESHVVVREHPARTHRGKSNLYHHRAKADSQSIKDQVAQANALMYHEQMYATETSKKPVDKVFQGYQGDKFGTRGDYMEGMVYRSRMKAKQMAKHGIKRESANEVQAEIDREAMELGMEEDGTEDGVEEDPGDEELSEEEEQTSETYEARQRCACTLRNWSYNQDNLEVMVDEGAVESLIGLAATDDRKTQAYAATAFRNLSAVPSLRKEMIEKGAVNTIVQLPESGSSSTMKDCAAALCNLSCEEGQEEQLVNENAVVTLMVMMQENEELSPICAQALFNLSCVTYLYPRMEKVVKAFVSLASSNSVKIKHITSQAFSNLSKIQRIRTRCVEEGVVQACHQLARGGDLVTRRLAAIVLQNLAAEKNCRAEMVNKSVVGALITLAQCGDQETHHWCAAALHKLALDKESRGRIVSQGAVQLLCEISKTQDKPTMNLCAHALQTLSCTGQEIQAKVVECGGVSAISEMLHTTEDKTTKNSCTLALCNLLSTKDSSSESLQQGVVAALVRLANDTHAVTMRSCALALYNLSCSESTRQMAVQQGVIVAIINLSRSEEQLTLQRCSATLCNLACDKNNRARMGAAKVIPCLVDVINRSLLGKLTRPDGVADTSGAIVRNCTSTICSLSFHQGCTSMIVEQGAVTPIIDICTSKTVSFEIRQDCCAILSNLSYNSSKQEELVNLGVLKAIFYIVEIEKENEATMRRCSVTLCNLSVNRKCRSLLVDFTFETKDDKNMPYHQNIVNIFSLLTNSYSEDNQQDCAKAICNLACNPGCEELLVKQGVVQAIMMIAMVHSVMKDTKCACAKALLNMITEDTLSVMVQEGMVQAFASLAKINDEEVMKYCAQAFCIISRNQEAREAIAAKHVALKGAFKLLRASESETRVTASKAVCNLLTNFESQQASVDTGAVHVLKDITRMMDDPQSSAMVSEALFILTCNSDLREKIVEDGALAVLKLLCTIGADEKQKGASGAAQMDDEATLNCVRALTNLAWDERTRRRIVDSGALVALISLAMNHEDVDTLRGCARALCYLSFYGPNRAHMVKDDVIRALIRIITITQQEGEVAEAEDVEDEEADGEKPAHDEAKDADTRRLSLEHRCAAKAHTPADRRGSVNDRERAEARGESWEIGQLICLTLRLLSWSTGGQTKMVADGAVKLLCELVSSFDRDSDGDVDEEDMQLPGDIDRALDCSIAFCNLAHDPSLRASLLTCYEPEDGSKYNVVYSICALGFSPDLETQWRCAAALRYLAATPHNRLLMVDQGATVQIIRMATNLQSKEETKKDCAAALCYLAKARKARQRMVQEGAIECLIMLSKNADPSTTTKFCASALRDLSSVGDSKLGGGTVKALISLSKEAEDAAKNEQAARLEKVKAEQDAVDDDAEPLSLKDAGKKVIAADRLGLVEDDPPPPPLAIRELNAPTCAAMPTESPEPHTIVHVKEEAGKSASPPPEPVPPIHEPDKQPGKSGKDGEDGEKDSAFFGKLELRAEERSRAPVVSLADEEDAADQPPDASNAAVESELKNVLGKAEMGAIQAAKEAAAKEEEEETKEAEETKEEETKAKEANGGQGRAGDDMFSLDLDTAGDQSTLPSSDNNDGSSGSSLPALDGSSGSTDDQQQEPPMPLRSEMPELPQIAGQGGGGMQGEMMEQSEYWDEDPLMHMRAEQEISMQSYSLGGSSRSRSKKKGKSKRRMYIQEVSDPAEKLSFKQQASLMGLWS
jgi:hypothetical protein